MKRKRFLLLLVALLALTTQAWAQGPTKVTKFTKELIASWEGVNAAITADDLNKIGFEPTDVATAEAWTGAPNPGDVILVYSIVENDFYAVFFFQWKFARRESL